MHEPRYSSLYQVNSRVLLTELSRSLGRSATLDDIPDGDLDRLAARGFDWVWLLSVWQTGPAGRRVAREHVDLRREYEATLPDLTDEDIAGSGFAIAGYTVHPDLGGDAALARLRARLRARGISLLLDFVPNHTALDHPWVETHPEFYVAGTEIERKREPGNYTRIGGRILAHGRDPHFPRWTDTLQLDYANPATRAAMTDELLRIAEQCDGVRCDMAMLLLPEVFATTWGIPAGPFWPRAIDAVRKGHPRFLFLAEVYWDLEWTLLEQGFDYAYDKRLYDRLRAGHARPVREHLSAGPDFQDRLARFLENHDEARAAAAFPRSQHEAAAIVTYLAPGLRFFHQGQLEGRKARVPVQLVRGPFEPLDAGLASFYERLLAVVRRPEVREGSWRLLECVPAWEGNWTWDCFLAWSWAGETGSIVLVTVNYADHASQCYVRLPRFGLAGHQVRLRDRTSPAIYDRDGSALETQGLYLDLPAWGYHAFDVGPAR